MISIQNITKQYQGITAIKDLTLTIPSGCLFGFIGPNGAGKTTTIRILAGILLPDAGTVKIAGIDLNTRPEKAKKKSSDLSRTGPICMKNSREWNF
jgi:ABC-2 type transport system ATP-binding protein